MVGYIRLRKWMNDSFPILFNLDRLSDKHLVFYHLAKFNLFFLGTYKLDNQNKDIFTTSTNKNSFTVRFNSNYNTNRNFGSQKDGLYVR